MSMQTSLSDSSDTIDSKNNTRTKGNSQLFSLIIIIVVIVVIFVIFNILAGGKFLTPSNMSIILSHATYPALIAYGIVFLFACNYIDLSLGAVLVLGAYTVNALGNLLGFPGVIAGGIAAGVLFVVINFSIFAFTRIPSWIAGIGLAMIYEGIALTLKSHQVIKTFVDVPLNENFRTLGRLPHSAVILAIGIIVAFIIYNRTTIGLNIRALGSNEEVARVLGINIKRTLISVGLICGIFVGVGAFIFESYIGQMTIRTGLASMYMVFHPLATVLLAQIMQKRINIIIAIPICAFIVYAIFNFLTSMNVPSGTIQEACLGFFVIAFGIVGRRGYKGIVK